MTLQLRDTLSGDMHEPAPDRRPDRAPDQPLTLYVCGITPYDSGHLGHAFTFVHFDVLVRALRWLGREVAYIQNVTDIDDSILRRARELGVDWQALGDEELERHLRQMDALNLERPTRLVPATSVIPDIHSMVGDLVARGHAYEADGSVFFRVKSAPHFGELSKLDREQMLAIAAEQDDADLDDPRKQDPLDVALWKRWSGDADEPQWPSPWGAGRPGWTIECAAINHRYCGPQVDMHGGGVDLVFPHHEVEIALVESATGRRPFVRTWLHTGMVHHQGAKMAKSLGNLVQVDDLLARDPAPAVRLYLLSNHYRSDWEFSAADLARAADRFARLRAAMGEPARDAPADRDEPADRDALAIEADFRGALEDDLDVPRALDALDRARGATARRLAGVLGLEAEAPAGRDGGHAYS